MKNIFISKSIIFFTWGALTIFLLAQYGFATEPDAMNRARIKPTLTKIKPGSEQQFYIVKEPGRLTAAYATNKVKWFVDGLPGGNKTLGTITEDGLYRAPEKAPRSPEIHICAEVRNSSNRYLWATVLLNGKRPRYKTVKEWGEAVDHSKHLKDPRAIDVESNGDILIADSVLLRFSPDGEFITQLGYAKGDVDASMAGLLNVKVDAEGRIFVSDTKTGPPRIQAFSPNGAYLYGFGRKGTGPGRVMDTRGMAFDTEQRLYIVDIDNMHVNVYEHSGKFLQAIGKKGTRPGEFNAPYGLALDANNDLFVVSYFGPCQKLTSDGHFVLDFAYADPSDGPIYFTDVASDRWGNVYIIVKGARTPDGGFKTINDANGKRVNIIKYNNNGDFIANLRLSSKDREPVRLVTDTFGKIIVLYKGEKKNGVEFLAESR
ncbi:MAG: hypothetical protein GXO75_01400 [Calditrichaeota bacterium]|nr:hypothetical protein [Calditrichota bacterium]